MKRITEKGRKDKGGGGKVNNWHIMGYFEATFNLEDHFHRCYSQLRRHSSSTIEDENTVVSLRGRHTRSMTNIAKQLINLEMPVLVRSLKSSNVKLG